MWSPTSRLETEKFLIYFEHLVITLHMHNKSITSETRDVVDILTSLRYQHVT
jgi:hypothetical protein